VVRLFASAQSWIEGEALRQLYATAKLDGVAPTPSAFRICTRVKLSRRCGFRD